MALTPDLPARVVFGPFEVNASTGELRRNGIPVRLPGQSYEILRLLLASRGELVTREQLRQHIWKEGTYVDFEHGLYAAVNKLRRSLGDSTDEPRYIETVPGRGYRFIGTVNVPSWNAPQTPAESVAPVSIASSRALPARNWRWWIAAGVLGCILSFIIGWKLNRPKATPSWMVRRISSEYGIASTPAISSDGKLIVYSYGDGSRGGRDLYLKQVTGGPAIRLTFDGADNSTPDFSPDGSRIVFHSNRNGGGLYEIPTFGGEIRLLVRDGRNPKFSPDGTRIAYWVGDDNVAAAVPGSGSVWIIAAAAGTPEQVAKTFAAARYPIWSPDGQQLLVVAYTSQKAYENSALDWWIVPLDRKAAISTGAREAFLHADFTSAHSVYRSSRSSGSVAPVFGLPQPYCWSAYDHAILFSGRNAIADTSNLWRARLAPETGKLVQPFTRFTAGAGNEVEASCGRGDTVTFTNLELRRELWTLPYDLNAGRANGNAQRQVEVPALREYPSLSKDGRSVAVASGQSDQLRIWKRELATGKESPLTNSPFMERFPVLSGSGEKVAFSSYEKDTRKVYISEDSGVPYSVCEGCLRATDWARDEKSILIFGGNPYRISVLDIASRRQTVLLEHPTQHLLYGHFSPDERWISFTARVRPDRGLIAIAPVSARKPIARSSWIPISEEGIEDWCVWSPDGGTIYFTSPRDGYVCFWGQRIDTQSHKPVGQPFPVQHFHGQMLYKRGGWSASRERFAMVLAGDRGTIWMMAPSTGR